MKTYIKALLDDQKSYYDEGKYYKSLKRLLLAAKYEDPSDKNLMVLIRLPSAYLQGFQMV